MPDQTIANSKAMFWAGWLMSGLVIAFMLFDGGIKLVPLDIVIRTSQQMGIPGSLARALGIIGLACTILYAIPHTRNTRRNSAHRLPGRRRCEPFAARRSAVHAYTFRSLSRFVGVGWALPA
jgi:hypothetical protein